MRMMKYIVIASFVIGSISLANSAEYTPRSTRLAQSGSCTVDCNNHQVECVSNCPITAGEAVRKQCAEVCVATQNACLVACNSPNRR